MAKRQPSDVDVWLKRETPRARRALESASRYFDGSDRLTVNVLEAVYGQESSFGVLMRQRGSGAAAGHFHLEPKTARQYGLKVSTENDQRFDVDYAASVAARYLKDLDSTFSKDTKLPRGSVTVAVRNAVERGKFVLGAYNGGQTHIADAQRRTEESGKNPRLWADVMKFLESEHVSESKADEIREYVEKVLRYQAEFAIKSPANKRVKLKEPRKKRIQCDRGHWVTIDDRPVYICD